MSLNTLYRQVSPLITIDQRKVITGYHMVAALREPDPVSAIISAARWSVP